MKKIVMMTFLLCASLLEAYSSQVLDTLTYAKGKPVNMTGKDLRGIPAAQVKGVSLKNSNLHNVRAGICTPSAKMKNVAGHVCNPKQPSNFAGIDFTGSDLSASDFSHAIFKGANVSGTNLTRACFKFVDFTGANFTGAIVGSTDFTGANLTGVTGFETVTKQDDNCIFTCALMPDGKVCIPGTKTWSMQGSAGTSFSISCNTPSVGSLKKSTPQKFCSSAEFAQSFSSQNLVSQTTSSSAATSTK